MKKHSGLVISLLVAVAGVANAATIEERIADCADLVDNQDRLTCFDELAMDTSATLQTGHAQSEEFGLEHKEANKDWSAELQALVTGLSKDALGKTVLVLDNGQVWRQRDAKTLIIKIGDPVSIERGSLSSFYLASNDGRRVRVERVR